MDRRVRWPSWPTGFSHPQLVFDSDRLCAGFDPGGQVASAMACETWEGEEVLPSKCSVPMAGLEEDPELPMKTRDSGAGSLCRNIRCLVEPTAYMHVGATPSLHNTTPLLLTRCTPEVPLLLTGMATRAAEAQAEERRSRRG